MQQGKLKYYVATTEPLSAPKVHQFTITATPGESDEIEKPLDVLIRPSKSLVGELKLSQLGQNSKLVEAARVMHAQQARPCSATV